MLPRRCPVQTAMRTHSSQFLFAAAFVVLRRIKGRATLYAELFVSLRDFLHCSAPRNQNCGCGEYKYKNSW